MRNDDFQSLQTNQNESTVSRDLLERLLRERLCNTISPLSVEIDCRLLKAWAKETSLERFRHQHLIKELRLWSPHLQRRPINRFWINDPFSIMDAPSLTELIYALGQNLKLKQGHHVEHAITLDCSAVTRQNIALLRGLEVNHIQVALRDDCTIEYAQGLQSLLAEFKFNFISFEISVAPEPSQDAMKIMEALSFLTPDTLTLKPSTLDLSHIENLAPMLMQFGYYFQAPNHILKFHSPLHSRPTDCIRLGPAQTSHLSDLELRSPLSADTYLHCVKHEQLPIASFR